MNNQAHFFNPLVFAAVALAHIGFLSLLWHERGPVKVELEHIQFVDLDHIGGLGGGSGSPEQAAAPKIQLPKPAAVQPKPIEKAKPAVKPVISKKAETAVPKPKEIIKPVDKIKPAEIPVEQAKPVEPKKAEAKKNEPVPSEKHETKQFGETHGKAAASNEVSNGGKEKDGGRGEGRSQNRGSAKGEHSEGGSNGGSSGAGSSKSNPVKANGSIPTPAYPSEALEANEEGTVVLNILVAPGGSVSSVKVVKSSGSFYLDRAAKKAARSGHFSANVWTQFRVPVRFRLNG